MAFTYQWQQAIDFLRSYARNIPVEKISAQICDAVSAEMWNAYPWKDACQTIPPTLLLDQTQDLDSPPTFFKLVTAQIVRTLPTYYAYDPLTITNNLPEVSAYVHPSRIRTISYQRGEGLLRLSYPPDLSSGQETFELHGSYQLSHTRVTDMDQYTWFSDQLWHVAQEGLLYWGYKLADRMAPAEAQYKVFRAKLTSQWIEETQGASDILMPEINLGDNTANEGY